MKPARKYIGILACLTVIILPHAGIADTGDGTVISTTKIQDNGPDTQRYNLVIMGDGYQASEITTYENHVTQVVNTINNQVVFGACDGAINIYRVNISSSDSGTDKPTPCYTTSTWNDTYLDTRYCGDGSTQRCIGSSNPGLVQTAANAATLNWHFVLVLVNDTEWGGCRWGNISYSSTGAGFQNIVVHELGHAIGNLGDEYEEFDGTYTGSEPTRPNLTAATNRADVKWYDLILPTTPVPTWEKTACNVAQSPPASLAGVVGTFEGGGRHWRCDIFRPQSTCLMRSSSQPFCAVCSRRMRQVFMSMSSDPNLSITPWGYHRNPPVHPYWQTDDIWCDNNGNGIQESNEPLIGKSDNHLFARITNTGSAPSGTYSVRFQYVPYTGVIDMANAQPIHTVSMPALADGFYDDAEVLWDLTTIPPAFSGVDHFCVIVDIIADECATYDNLAQNNFGEVPTVGPSPAPISMYIKNTLPQAATGRVIIEPDPTGWEITANLPNLDAIPLAANEEKLITIKASFKGKCPAMDRLDKAAVQLDTDVCKQQQFDLSFALDGDVLGGVSSEIIVHRPTKPRYKRGISLHLGGTEPIGDLDTFFDPGLMAGLDIEYALKQKLMLVGLVGYNRFKGDFLWVPDTYLWNVSLNLKYELGAALWRPYINGGAGVYFPEYGSNELGFNLGAGVRRDLAPRWILELGGDHHRISADGDEVEFRVYHLGLVYRF
jgi:hypothetical protein